MTPSQQVWARTMISMTRFFLLLAILFTAFPLLADTFQWKKGDFVFESDTRLYQDLKSSLDDSSAQIADFLSSIKATKIPASIFSKFERKKVVIIYEKNSATDAMFFPPGTKRQSSEEEFILTVNPAVIESPTYLRIIAHEFFHAVHFVHNKDELSWVREGLAQLFETKISSGYNIAHIHAGLTESNFPLESNFDTNHYSPEKYGNTLLYFLYLTAQCSQNKNFLWSFVREGTTGRETINEVLKDLQGTNDVCRSFETSALAFSLAKLMNTYSGFEQSSKTFLFENGESLPIDPKVEGRLITSENSFWATLAPYRPLKIRSETAVKLKNIPSSVRLFSLEKDYPNAVKEVSKGDLKSLGMGLSVGVIKIGPNAD